MIIQNLTNMIKELYRNKTIGNEEVQNHMKEMKQLLETKSKREEAKERAEKIARFKAEYANLKFK